VRDESRNEQSMNAPLRAPLSLLAALLLLSCAQLPLVGHPRESGEWTAGTAPHEVSVAGDARGYLLHIPSQHPRSRLGITQPYPVVIVLHGSSGNAESARHASQMDSLSDARDFLVAYPNGTKGRLALYRSDWNAGECCGAAQKETMDDVGFMRAIIEQLGEKLPIDRRRVYVAGFSDGGRLAYRIACEMGPVVAAIAVVSGSLELEKCAPARPMPIVAFHGTSDEEVAYDDSSLTAPIRPVPPWAAALPPTFRFWAVQNGCGRMESRRQSPHVTRALITRCRGGVDMALYTIDGGVHGWPGEPAGGAGAEPAMAEVHASDVMVRFFFRHALP
jgi:polyhydroxybutyrate depolymerase